MQTWSSYNVSPTKKLHWRPYFPVLHFWAVRGEIDPKYTFFSTSFKIWRIWRKTCFNEMCLVKLDVVSIVITRMSWSHPYPWQKVICIYMIITIFSHSRFCNVLEVFVIKLKLVGVFRYFLEFTVIPSERSLLLVVLLYFPAIWE